MKCPQCGEDAGMERWPADVERGWPCGIRTLQVAGQPLKFAMWYPLFIQKDWILKEQEKAEKEAERYSERARSEYRCYACLFEWDAYPFSRWGKESW